MDDGLGQGFNVAGQLMSGGMQATSGAIAAMAGLTAQVLNIAVRVGEEVLPMVFKVGKFAVKDVGYEKMLKGIGVLGGKGIEAHYKKKHGGSVKLKKLLKKKGEEVTCFRFPEEKRETVLKALQDRGVLFYTLPDLNEKDGMSEVMFHVCDIERVNQLADRLGLGKVVGVEEYLKNADPDTVDKAFEEAKEEAVKEGKAPTKTGQELEKANRREPVRQNTSTITVNKDTLLLEETKEHYVIKVPGAEEFFSVAKEQVESLESGKALRVYLQNDKTYMLYDRSGAMLGEKNGVDLQKKYHTLPERREYMKQLNKKVSKKPVKTGKRSPKKGKK